MIAWFLCSLAAYLLGSIPSGLLLVRLVHSKDIRRSGSGNIGATNVLRSAGPRLGLVTLLLDGGKVALAICLARAFAEPVFFNRPELLAASCAFMAFLGHVFPVWLRFRGGKGIACFLGAALMLYFPLGCVAALSWASLALAFRFSSLAGIGAALTGMVGGFILDPVGLGAPLAAMTLLILFAHKQNIRRLLMGTEPRIFSRSRTEASQ